MSLPCRLMYLPSTGGIDGSFATVLLTTTSTTNRTTSVNTPRRTSRCISVSLLQCGEALGHQRADGRVHFVGIGRYTPTPPCAECDARSDDRHLEVAQRHVEVPVVQMLFCGKRIPMGEFVGHRHQRRSPGRTRMDDVEQRMAVHAH